ncbi:sporulation integral membrane protein YtvI [Shouchella patagoniensis]|uniref:sporulation integral membrane protein YtvI n=1 Tax=Shouchella patagoniensis TaxID=228576 RepID=UPI000995077C|nr:sporulation integral membrane protein YtvI [Shouchella patagoniensis]
MSSLINKKILKIIVITIALVIAAYLILPVSYPLLVAFLVALLLAPIVRWFKKTLNIKRELAVTIVFIMFILLIILISYLIVTQLIYQGVQFIENSPIYIMDITEGWDSFIQNIESAFSDLPDAIISTINEQIIVFLNELRSNANQVDIISTITAGVAKIPGYFVSFIVFIIALFLFMIEMPKLRHSFYNKFTEETSNRLQIMIKRFSNAIFGFLKAQFIVSVPIFLISLIGLFIITPDVALTMALVIWIIDFIPFIGSIVILSPWAIYLMLVGDTDTGIKLLILAGVLLIIRRTVEPKVMGKQIGLSPLLTLISMYLGAQFFGLIGLIIGPLSIIAFTSAKEAGVINGKKI